MRGAVLSVRKQQCSDSVDTLPAGFRLCIRIAACTEQIAFVAACADADFLPAGHGCNCIADEPDASIRW